MKKEQKKLINALTNLWKLHPDIRFTQLLVNYTLIGTSAGRGKVKDPFCYEDEWIINNLEECFAISEGNIDWNTKKKIKGELHYYVELNDNDKIRKYWVSWEKIQQMGKRWGE